MLTNDYIDAKLKQSASNLFELDDVSREILACIAKKGPQTIYELNKNKALSKAAVYRRLHGQNNLLSLLDENYLRLEGVVPFGRIKGIDKKFYGLTLKGFLASLSKIKCKDNYMFRVFLQVCQHQGDWKQARNTLLEQQRKEVLEKVRLKIEIDLWIFLQYHMGQGLPLTKIKHVNIYFLNTCTLIWSSGMLDDPLYRDYFGPDWNDIWNARLALEHDTEIPSVTTVLYRGPNGEIKRKQTRPFPDAWTGVFVNCWISATDPLPTLETHPKTRRTHYYWPFLKPLVEEYGDVVGKLREGGPAWDLGILFVGTPLQELEKNHS